MYLALWNDFYQENEIDTKYIYHFPRKERMEQPPSTLSNLSPLY